MAGSAVQDRIVWPSVLPGAPENPQPGAADDADCVGMPTSSATRAGVNSRGPCAGVARVVREAGQCGAQASVAGPSERDPAGLAGLASDRPEASIGGKLIGGQIAGAILAQLSQDLTGKELTCPREAHEDLTILAERCLMADARGQVDDAGDELPENGNKGRIIALLDKAIIADSVGFASPHHFSARFGLTPCPAAAATSSQSALPSEVVIQGSPHYARSNTSAQIRAKSQATHSPFGSSGATLMRTLQTT